MKIFMTFMFFLLSNISHTYDYKNSSQFGNKTANLAKTSEAIKNIADEQFLVAVPEFFAFSHDEMTSILANIYPQIIEQWGRFKSAQSTLSDEDLELTPAGKIALKAIRDLIREGFAHIEEIEIKDSRRQKELSRFLRRACRHLQALVVRSTGREDSKEIANAGGNVSISNVAPTLRAITQKAASVLEAYFSEQSFKQRIIGGESRASLLQDPFLPLLIQVMVQEKHGQLIPTSGVAFSRETFANTPGVVMIDAIFGHGEAVVNSLYPVDTYIVSESDMIYPIIRRKPKRLAPGPLGQGLIPILNSHGISVSSTLLPAEARFLTRIVKSLENDREETVDVEFVMLGNQFYIVQVRPIVETVNNPRYLSDSYVKERSDQIIAETIVTGGAELKHIKSSEEIIASEQIRKALFAFLDLDKAKRDLVKLTLTGQNAARTSHEATVFRSKNVPVLYVPDFQKVMDPIKEKAEQLVDVQRGIIIRATNYDEKLHLVDGWLKHPIPEQISVDPRFIENHSNPESIEHNDFSKLGVIAICELVANSDDALEALKALQTLRKRVGARIEQEVKQQMLLQATQAHTDEDLIAKLNNTLNYFLRVSVEVEEALTRYFNSEKTSVDRLQRLFPINFMMALLRQKPNNNEILFQNSLASTLKTQKTEAILTKQLALGGVASRSFFVQFVQFKKHALTDQVEANWVKFLTDYAHVVKDPQPFVRMMKKVVALGIVPLWLNVNFADYVGDANAQADLLMDQMARNRDLFERVQKTQDLVTNFPWSRFAVAEKVPLAVHAVEVLLTAILKEPLVMDYHTSAFLGKSAIIALLTNLVPRYDEAMKGISAKNDFENAVIKAEHFSDMLENFFGILEFFMINFLVNKKPEAEKYLKELKILIDKSIKISKVSEESAKKSFLPSRTFNVVASRFGSRSNFKRSTGLESTRGGGNSDRVYGYHPSLEDLFSLVHQNLLTIIGMLTSDLESHLRLTLPPLLSNLIKAVLYTRPMDRSGITYAENEISILYNQPLRNHSNWYEFVYDTNDKTTTFRVHFNGEARERWEALAFLLTSLPNFGPQLVSGPFVDYWRGQLDFTWKIKNQEDIMSAQNALGTMIVIADIMFKSERPDDYIDMFAAVMNSYSDYADTLYIAYLEKNFKNNNEIKALLQCIWLRKYNVAILKGWSKWSENEPAFRVLLDEVERLSRANQKSRAMQLLVNADKLNSDMFKDLLTKYGERSIDALFDSATSADFAQLPTTMLNTFVDAILAIKYDQPKKLSLLRFYLVERTSEWVTAARENLTMFMNLYYAGK